MKKFAVLLLSVVATCLTFAPPGTAAEMTDVTMWAVNDFTNGDQTLDRFKVDGLAPWDISNMEVTGPGDYSYWDWNIRFHTTYTYKDHMVYASGWPETFPLTDGDYTLTLHAWDNSVIDSETIVGFTYNELEQVDISTALPVSGSYVETTEPSLSWTAISDETATPYYQVAIRAYSDYEPTPVYISDRQTTTTLDVPSGKLLPDTTYKWQVLTYDGANESAFNVSTSDWSTFSTGDGDPATNPMVVSSASIVSRTKPNGANQTKLYVSLTGPSPEDVTVEVTGPLGGADEATYTFAPNDYYQYTYAYTHSGQLSDGDYRFTITDNRVGSGGASQTFTRELQGNWSLTAPGEDDLNIDYNSYLYTDQPTVIWNAIPGATSYKLSMYTWDWMTPIDAGVTASTMITVPDNVLKKNAAYHLRVEAYDSIGNRATGEDIPIFIAEDYAPANISGTIAAGTSGAGGPIYVILSDGPVLPDGELLGMTRLETPGTYTLYNVPRGMDVYVHALWDVDNSFSYTVGDWKGRYPAVINLSPSESELDNYPYDITLETEVAGASLAGTVSCANWEPESGDIYIGIFQWESDDSPIATASLTAPGAYFFDNLPVDGVFYVKAYWDADGVGGGSGPTSFDHTGEYPGSVTILAGGTTGVDFSIETTGFITGQVTDADNGDAPIEGLHVYVQDSVTNDYIDGEDTDSNGYYTVAVPSGTYEVTACPDCSELAYVEQRVNNVSVTDPDPTTVNFSLNRGGTISGVVTEEGGITKIANLWMEAFSWDNDDWVGGAWTATDGSYTIRVDAGNYRVRACASCNNRSYVDEYYDDTDWGDADPVPVSTDTDTPGIDFELATGFAISGTVTESGTTTAIDSVCINIETTKCNGGWIDGTQSNDDGTYSIYVPAGTYYVQTDTICGGNSPQNKLYINSYYDGADGSAQDCDLSQPVTVGPDAPNINFALTEGGAISGTVYESDGTTPVTGYSWEQGYNIGVSVFTGGCNNRQHLGWAPINPADGTYFTSGLPAGNYQMETVMRGTDFVDMYWGTPASTIYCDDNATVAVSVGNDNQGKDFQLDDAMKISGLVYHSGDTSNTVTDMRIEARDADSFGYVGDAYSDDTGNYTLRLPAGEYLLQACATCDPSGSDYVNEWYEDQPSASTADRVDIRTQDESGKDFDLAIGAVVSGTLFDSVSGQPITGKDDIEIVAFIGDPCGYQQYLNGVFMDTGSGDYELRGLPAGDVHLKVQTGCSHYVGQFYDHDLSTQGQCNADPLPLTAGQQATVDFDLELGGTVGGTVTSVTAQTPISNLWMSVRDVTTGNHIAGSNTHNDGSYCVGVPAVPAPGTDYAVFAQAAGSFTNPAYIGEYYDDVRTLSGATPVTVVRDTMTANIDFALNVVITGDLDGDEDVDLADVIQGLQLLTDTPTVNFIGTTGDTNDDNRVNLPDILWIMDQL